MTEINPKHRVTQEMREMWYKVLAVILHKYKLGRVEITTSDLANLACDFPNEMPCIVIKDDKETGFHVWLAHEDEAMKLSERERFQGRG